MGLLEELLDIDYKVRIRKKLEPNYIDDWELSHIGVILGLGVCRAKIISECSSLLPCILNLPIDEFSKIELISGLVGDVKIELHVWLEVKDIDVVDKYLISQGYVKLGSMNYMGKNWLVYSKNINYHFIDVGVTTGYGSVIPRRAVEHLADLIVVPWKWIEIDADWLGAKVKTCIVTESLEEVKERARKVGYMISFIQEKPISERGMCWEVSNAGKLIDLLQDRKEVVGIAHSNKYFIYVLSKNREETDKYIREKIKIDKGYVVIQV